MDAEAIKRIAHLARLQVNEDKIPEYAKNLTDIIALGEKMQKVETLCEPMAHPLDLKQRLREDIVTEQDEHKTFQACAPEVAYDLYLVPKVIDQE